MDYKEQTKELCSSFFQAFRVLEAVKDDLSVVIIEKVVEAFHYDGLLSSIKKDDIHVVFEPDGCEDVGFDTIVIKIILPLDDGGRLLSVNGLVLKALSDFFGLQSNQISVGHYSWQNTDRLSLSIYLDCLSDGVGFDWASEYDHSVPGILSDSVELV